MATMTSSPGFQRPRLASTVSTMSEFSVISNPMSPVFVEPESDDDEIVFSPMSRAPSTSPFADRRPASTAFGETATEDDFILITSPRIRPRTTLPELIPVHSPAPLTLGATVAAVAVPPASARVHPLPCKEPPQTPTTTKPQPIPAPKSSRATQRRTEPAKVVTVPISAAPAKARNRRTAKPKADKVTPVASVKAAEAYPSPSPTPSPPTPTPRGAITAVINADQRHIQSHGFAAETASAGFGARGVVVEDEDDDKDRTLYNAAVAYVTSYLEDPIESDAKRLPLLQAMLIELGICPPAGPLPQSIRSARAMLKSKALINVRDYMAERGRSLEALRKVIFPTKKKLIKDLRARRVPLPWIKERGLTMFLSHMHY